MENLLVIIIFVVIAVINTIIKHFQGEEEDEEWEWEVEPGASPVAPTPPVPQKSAPPPLPPSGGIALTPPRHVENERVAPMSAFDTHEPSLGQVEGAHLVNIASEEDRKPRSKRPLPAWRRDRKALRRAIIAREVLDRPRAYEI